MKPQNIYARDKELEELRQFVNRRRSFLVHGSAGVGKTLLLSHLASETSAMLYCDDPSSTQVVFRTLAAGLFAKGNRHVIKICGKSGLKLLKDKSAISLRGIVNEALKEKPYWIVLDHVQSASQSFASLVKDMCNSAQTPLIAAARSAHMEDVGFLLPMFSSRTEKLGLKNFDPDTAKAFALQVAHTLCLEAANRDEAIQKIVSFSKGNPGAIVAMLQMAVSPKYASQQHVKLSPLYIDFRLSWGANHG